LTTGAAVKKKRVVSGMRPTGRLHIGHYFGALANWERLQNATIPSHGTESGLLTATGLGSVPQVQNLQQPEYNCFFFVADWHALTSDYADTSDVAENTIQITTDYLAAGIDPDKSVLFQQSQVEEHAELHLLLSMVTPLGWLERVPTYKEQIENVTNKDLHTYGFLGYPCLQTADIVIYSEEGTPLFVPVGEDQASHVELSREIVSTFNFQFGFEIEKRLFEIDNVPHLEFVLRAAVPIESKGQRKVLPHRAPTVDEQDEYTKAITRVAKEVGIRNFLELMGNRSHFFRFRQRLTEPSVLLTKTPRVPGLDGRKMSKSYGNAITLSESDTDIRAKTKVMKTDPARQRRTDPGNPDVCPVFDWHKLFSSVETQEWAAAGCRSAGIGCIECKSKMADGLIQWIAPVRERRLEYEKHPGRVLEILEEGSFQARKVAQQTMIRVREAVFGWNKKRKEILGAEGGGGAGGIL
jgi:tryptophanyl-tRNA synthetase